jgi:hypothetical protein
MSKKKFSAADVAAALHKENRKGKYHPDLVCRLIRIDVGREAVHLYFPEGDCCDMRAAIALARAVRPRCDVVQTWSGDKADTCYECFSGHWRSFVWQKKIIWDN